MKILIYLIFFMNIFSEQKKIVLGGSLDKREEYSNRSDYVRGVISYLNSVIDDEQESSLVPEAIFYENLGKASIDVSNTQKLIFSNKAKALFGYSSREGIVKSIELLKDNSIKMFCPTISLERDFLIKHEIETVRPSIEEDLDEVVNFVNQTKKDKIAIVCEAESWQEEYILNKLNGDGVEIKVFLYISKPIKINRCLLDVKNFEPDLIIVLNNIDLAINFLKKYSFFKSKIPKVVLPFYLYGSKLVDNLSESNLDIYVGKLFDDLKSRSEIVEDYSRFHKRYFPNNRESIDGLEGYITAYCLLRAYSENVSIDSVSNKFKSSRIESLK